MRDYDLCTQYQSLPFMTADDIYAKWNKYSYCRTQTAGTVYYEWALFSMLGTCNQYTYMLDYIGSLLEDIEYLVELKQNKDFNEKKL